MTIYCKDCEHEGKRTLAFVTWHDKRGCHHLCWEHLKERQKRHASVLFGHSKDCPHFTLE